MRIRVDHDRCRGAGQCALNAPELFDQSEDDGTVVLLDDHPPAELHDQARLAAALCPNAVISLIEGEDQDEGEDEDQDES
ncbi:ferredoxin [Peterkaempfera bronchialis]|uniref:Ferredoxin n=1 Tax=Peterkaempfera bronchialis TaxID=2126346 RepID=A0A345STZ5_9ACTN|nr:ferredoxin [Peterkaempfera bronchialis]AXI77200.1 ferredoxin [Peterkaempfera bronchialis]